MIVLRASVGKNKVSGRVRSEIKDTIYYAIYFALAYEPVL